MIEAGIHASHISDSLLEARFIHVLAFGPDRDRPAAEHRANRRRDERSCLFGRRKQQVLIGRRLEIAVIRGAEHRTCLAQVIGDAHTGLYLRSAGQKSVPVEAQSGGDHPPSELPVVLREKGRERACRGAVIPEQRSSTAEVKRR